MISTQTKIDSKFIEKSKKVLDKNIKYNNVDKGLAYKYIPFIENDILLIANTLTSVNILLRNGTIMNFIPEGSEKEIKTEIKDFLLPKIIKIPVKIIDLCCGNDHCLALGIYNKIYSWGSDSFGQLGLSDFYVASDARKDDPTEIPSQLFIKCKNIIRIYAGDNSSFALSDNNYIYGWGMIEDEENGSLTQKILKTPTLLDSIPNDYTIYVGKNKSKVYLCEYETKPFEIGEILEMNKNKALYSMEQEKREELEKLKIELSQVKKERISVADYESLLCDVKGIINNIKDKINIIELKSSKSIEDEYDCGKNIITFTKQLEYLNGKSEAVSKENLSDILIIEEKLKFKHYNTQIIIEKKLDDNGPQNFKMVSKDMYEIVKREIEHLKNNKLNNFWKSEINIKKIEKQKNQMKDLMLVFEEVIKETKDLIKEKEKKDSVKNLNPILEELKSVFPSIKINRLSSSTQIKNNENSILENINQSINNYARMEVKISNMIWNDKNPYITSTLDMVKSNITLSQQNNILMKQISKHSKNFYSALFHKAITNDNPQKVSELKEEINLLKKNNFIEFQTEGNYEGDMYSELNIDNSF